MKNFKNTVMVIYIIIYVQKSRHLPDIPTRSMLFFDTLVSWFLHNFTIRKSLLREEGPYFFKAAFKLFKQSASYANSPVDFRSCSVFLIWLCSPQRLTAVSGSSISSSRFLRIPLQLDKNKRQNLTETDRWNVQRFYN